MNTADQNKTHVLIIIGHPRQDSFSHAIAAQYAKGLDQNCFEVQTIDLAYMAFAADISTFSPNDTPLEPALVKARELMLWADHLVFVYPNWWGTFPAKLKGFFDRVLNSGFAFYEDHEPGVYQPLLKGKTAEIFVTMDTPPVIYNYILGRPGHRAVADCILGFCGIKPTHVTSFGIMKGSSLQQRELWLENVSLRAQALNPWRQRAFKRLKRVAWIKMLRLQFYPMSFIAFVIGALAAWVETGQFSWLVFILGYLTLFCFKAATVFSNEIYDYASDKQNENYSPFNGGSRVLVEGEITPREAKRATGYLLLTAAVLALGVYLTSTAISGLSLLLLLSVTLLTTLGYTIPPFKWVYRGLGEVVVGITHSFLVVIGAYVIQSGNWFDAMPWLLSFPLCVAILPAIILSAVPDYHADKITGKRTLAVIFGPQRAVGIAMYCVIATIVLTVFIWPWLLASWLSYVFIGLMMWHGWRLHSMLNAFYQQNAPVRRINSLMMSALSFILWPSVIALIDLSLQVSSA